MTKLLLHSDTAQILQKLASPELWPLSWLQRWQVAGQFFSELYLAAYCTCSNQHQSHLSIKGTFSTESCHFTRSCYEH